MKEIQEIMTELEDKICETFYDLTLTESFPRHGESVADFLKPIILGYAEIVEQNNFILLEKFSIILKRMKIQGLENLEK